MLYLDIMDGSSSPILHVSISTRVGFSQWGSRDESSWVKSKPYTPTVMDIIDTINILKAIGEQGYTYHEENLAELEEYLYEHQG